MRNGAQTIAASVASALARSRTIDMPFRYHLLDGMLPRGVCEALAALPVATAEIGDTKGKRETHNSLRIFLDPDSRARYPVCDQIAAAFQRDPVVSTVEQLCGIALAGTYLRIEYCQDLDGFWLEPHTDIGAKKFTQLIYLSADPGCEDWGTDIYDDAHRHIARASYRRNEGLAFVPGADTWHGFDKRPIGGIRKSLIVNYVDAAWRSRHELSFPDRPIADGRNMA